MLAADLVVAVVSCASGVTFNLSKKLLRAGEMGRGRAIVITHLDAENTDFDVLVEEQVPVVSFHFGAPPEAVERLHGAGVKVLSSATTVAEARWCVIGSPVVGSIPMEWARP